MTGPRAIEAAEQLRAERDAAREAAAKEPRSKPHIANRDKGGGFSCSCGHTDPDDCPYEKGDEPVTRRTHPCLGCSDAPGTTPFNRPRRTRHKDQVCALCRRRGITHRDGVLTVPIVINFGGRRA